MGKSLVDGDDSNGYNKFFHSLIQGNNSNPRTFQMFNDRFSFILYSDNGTIT